MLRHDGEILKKLIGKGDIPISRIAKQMGVNRSTIYRMFDKADIPIDFLLKIGKVINKDMSPFFPEVIQAIQEPPVNYSSPKSYSELLDERRYWKDKYINILEKCNSLLNNQLASTKSTKVNKKPSND
ncbi:helix-turn-helix domain-containing protein [Albibacterium bauzanense]|nr:helix-turn-helix domain-containing protein [Albibacterium bauzanense]